MSVIRNQSQIAEVRDQLSIDHADGQYLNIVGQNLGMSRPVFGFSNDSEWRALVKAIALQYKQTRNRFRAVLAILFGPQVTVVGTIAQAVAVGDKSVFVTDASKFPQLGTLILDEGQANAETLKYCYIEYGTNEIFLDTDVITGFTHSVTDSEGAESSVIIANSAGTKVIVSDARSFPSTGFPYTAIIGRGTSIEEIVSITAVDKEEGSLTLAGALTMIPVGLGATVVQSTLLLPYTISSSFLTLKSSRQFPESGVILLDVKTTEFTAIAGGSTLTIPVLTGTWSANVHASQYVRFAKDTATAALQGIERSIVSNTASELTITPALPVSPASGDRFVVIQPPFTATAGSTSSVTLAAGTFTANFQVGNRVVFDGNITGALAGVEADIVLNTTTVLTFAQVLGTAPVSGDTFRIRARTEYESNDGVKNILTLPFSIRDLTVPEEVAVELMQPGETIVLAPVKVAGVGWDLFEVTPRELEIYLPELLQDFGDLRSASYLHGSQITPVYTDALSAAAIAGDSFIDIVDFTNFPLVGVVTLDIAGINERVGYYKNGVKSTGSLVHTGATILDTETFILSDGTNPAVVFEFDTDNSVVQSYTLRKVDISTATTDNDRRDAIIVAVNGAPLLTITASIGISADGVVDLANNVGGNDGNVTVTETVVDASFVAAGMSGGVDRLTLATQVLANSFAPSDTVDLYQPIHAGTTLLLGDGVTTVDTFTGPYSYDLESDAATGTVALTELDSLLPGPTGVTIGTVPTHTALEVEDAQAFDLVNFPYTIVVGRNTGNREIITVTDVNLKQRAATTVSATVAIGDNTIVVADTTGAAATDAADFPDSNGYRILLDRGGINEEVVYVINVLLPGAAGTLVLQENVINTHAIGETVELMSDVLSVNALTDTHLGRIPYLQRASANTTPPALARFPSFTSTEILAAEVVEPEVSSFTLLSTAGLDITGGTVILNPANGLVGVSQLLTIDLSAGGTAVTVADSAGFPDTGFPYVVTLSKGTPREEQALCTANNTITGVLTLNSGGAYGVKFAHLVATSSTISWEPGLQESIEYSGISGGTTLSFSPSIVLQSTHSPSEAVVDSSVKSSPRSNGYDFSLRMPADIQARIKLLWDLIRAAGVQVTIINKR